MAHRRKSSHPVSKTRRQLTSNWEPLQPSEDEDDIIEEKPPRSPGQCQEEPVTMETGQDSAKQMMMIPPDLFKDFEAVRSQAKMDATDLMRRLLKDYQSLATTSDKPMTSLMPVQHEDHHDPEVDQNAADKASISTDVSLATARVDTDEDEFQGLDLSLRSRKINSRLFDTKSLETGSTGLDQPLDLTCSKPPVTSESLDRESPSSTQLEGVHNEFNYVYVYPGIYPPGSGILPHEEIESESPNPVTSPVPDLISPGRLSPPLSVQRSAYTTSTDPLEKNFGLVNPGLAYNNFMNTMAKTALPESISPTPRSTPNMIGSEQETREMFEPQRKVRISPNAKKPSSPSSRQEKVGKAKDKRSNEIKVISENITFPGVYTSVMKLPWSRRTRTKTKKPKHKLKLEDTLIPQFMLNQSDQSENPGFNPPENAFETNTATRSYPNSTESVMMVYPNATTSAYGKPIRKRGRPPKLPMLAKLLQHEQASKRANLEKKQTQRDETEAQLTQQVQANGGMLVYNSGGQVVTAYAGAPPLPANGQQATPSATATSMSQMQTIHQLPPHMMPNMSQAQFLGQIPLSQLMGGPIQFLGQFPANALPVPGPTIQGFPMQGPEQTLTGNKDQDGGQNQNHDGVPSTGFQYAFQPVFIPTPMQAPTPVQPDATTATSEPNKLEEMEIEQSYPKDGSPQEIVDSSFALPGINPDNAFDNSPHVMKHEHSNTISTMSTTSIANTGTGAMYQEMILSSKSLVNVKKRKRQTAIQLLKSKSHDQNFLCTSFRIRPRLVAQAEAQRERMSVKDSGESVEMIENEIDSKNLNGPQSDMVHFGENTQSLDLEKKAQIKQESDFYELYEAYGINSAELDIKQEVDEALSILEECTVPRSRQSKRFMLKGSQKRKAKAGCVLEHGNENGTASENEQHVSNELAANSEGTSVIDKYPELFNCKICNTIIPVHQIEAHSLEHVRKNRRAARLKCKTCGGLCEKPSKGYNNECNNCKSISESTFKVENAVYSTHGHGKIACDECPETFKSLPDFYEHKTESHKDTDNDQSTLQQGEFECDLCGKMYQFYHALQYHQRTVHHEKKVPCFDNSCEQKFRSRRDMENHFDLVHPDKKDYYHCVYEGCSKKFLKNFHLQEHIRVKHYNIKAFQCPWPGCIKEFAARRHLKIHLLIHRDEKPMKCDHCDYRCRQRSAMNWHMRKHPDVSYKYKRSTKPPSVSTPESE